MDSNECERCIGTGKLVSGLVTATCSRCRGTGHYPPPTFVAPLVLEGLLRIADLLELATIHEPHPSVAAAKRWISTCREA